MVSWGLPAEGTTSSQPTGSRVICFSLTRGSLFRFSQTFRTIFLSSPTSEGDAINTLMIPADLIFCCVLFILYRLPWFYRMCQPVKILPAVLLCKSGPCQGLNMGLP